MKQSRGKSRPTGIKLKFPPKSPPPSVELFGHVFLVEGYAVPAFYGCHALVALRDNPGVTIAVMTDQHRLQTLLETALSTGNLVDVRGWKYTTPPTPLGGTWSVDVYHCTGLILYNAP